MWQLKKSSKMLVIFEGLLFLDILLAISSKINLLLHIILTTFGNLYSWGLATWSVPNVIKYHAGSAVFVHGYWYSKNTVYPCRWNISYRQWLQRMHWTTHIVNFAWLYVITLTTNSIACASDKWFMQLRSCMY